MILRKIQGITYSAFFLWSFVSCHKSGGGGGGSSSSADYCTNPNWSSTASSTVSTFGITSVVDMKYDQNSNSIYYIDNTGANTYKLSMINLNNSNPSPTTEITNIASSLTHNTAPTIETFTMDSNNNFYFVYISGGDTYIDQCSLSGSLSCSDYSLVNNSDYYKLNNAISDINYNQSNNFLYVMNVLGGNTIYVDELTGNVGSVTVNNIFHYANVTIPITSYFMDGTHNNLYYFSSSPLSGTYFTYDGLNTPIQVATSDVPTSINFDIVNTVLYTTAAPAVKSLNIATSTSLTLLTTGITNPSYIMYDGYNLFFYDYSGATGYLKKIVPECP
jgi:hypothetical protein